VSAVASGLEAETSQWCTSGHRASLRIEGAAPPAGGRAECRRAAGRGVHEPDAGSGGPGAGGGRAALPRGRGRNGRAHPGARLDVHAAGAAGGLAREPPDRRRDDAAQSRAGLRRLGPGAGLALQRRVHPVHRGAAASRRPRPAVCRGVASLREGLPAGRPEGSRRRELPVRPAHSAARRGGHHHALVRADLDPAPRRSGRACGFQVSAHERPAPIGPPRPGRTRPSRSSGRSSTTSTRRLGSPSRRATSTGTASASST
jgi:hypothetical protein